MTLKQTLAPNERGTALFDKGEFLGYEDIVIISDEDIAEEAEIEALSKVDTLIDQIDSLAKARVFLKRLCKRLIIKGYLP